MKIDFDHDYKINMGVTNSKPKNEDIDEKIKEDCCIDIDNYSIDLSEKMKKYIDKEQKEITKYATKIKCKHKLESVFEYAFYNEHIEIIKEMINYDLPNLSGKYEYECCNYSGGEEYESRGECGNSRCMELTTPLIKCFESEKFEKKDMLIICENITDSEVVNRFNYEMKTPMMFVDDVEIFELLIKLGADLTCKSYLGESVQDYIVQTHDVDLIKLCWDLTYQDDIISKHEIRKILFFRKLHANW